MNNGLAYCLSALMTAFCCSAATAEPKPIIPDLSRIGEGKAWNVSGRKATAFDANGRRGVSFDKTADIGVAWSKEIEFSEGEIEIDIKGENKEQQSFVGIAFRVVDATTHDAVYFRPFNFKSNDPVKRAHAVQYVSHPKYQWKTLREETPGRYENSVRPVPDPNGWFHARIAVAKRTVSVYVDNAKDPCLVVHELSERKGGKVGLWIGDGSGGAFANLKITRKRQIASPALYKETGA